MDSSPKDSTTSTFSTISTTSTVVNGVNGSPHKSKKSKFIDGLLPPPPTVPADHDRRTLVLCFDGTGDSYDDDNSNVLDFFSMLKKDNPNKQVVYYQTGVGISPAPRYITTIANGVQKATDEALATSLDDHVQQGYGFIVQNYKYGDKICLFGFSRGAYTARALAGMLHKVGLLPKNNAQHIPFAYNMYKREEKDWRQSNNFKSAFSIDVKVEFVGVWDTVSSVGIWPSTLPFTSSNKSIRYFRHAIALDERRAKFQPNPWNEPTQEDQKKGIDQNTTSTEVQLHKTDVKEVWFAGCHCDIGGGSVKNDTPHALAKNPLRWMIRECFKVNSGIMFYEKPLKKLGFDVTAQYLGGDYSALSPGINPLRTQEDDVKALQEVQKMNALQTQAQADAEQLVDVASYATEKEQEVLDALSPIYDQLSAKWSWYILEAVPFRRDTYKTDDKNGTSKTDTRWPNFGGERILPPPAKGKKTLVHRSVQTRMAVVDKNGKRQYEGIKSLQDAIKRNEVEWAD